jgi:hypothetical protein
MAGKLPISAARGPVRPQNNPAYDEKIRNRERIKAERRAALAAETASLVEELRGVGIDIAYLGDLRYDTPNFERGIAIILEHLAKDYSEPTKSVIAFLLTTPKAKIGWPTLVEEYRRTEQGVKPLCLKNTLAAALAQTVTSSTEDELLKLAQDRQNGTSRVLLLRGLRRSWKSEIKQALLDLASDPDLKKEITSWKRSKYGAE